MKLNLKCQRCGEIFGLTEPPLILDPPSSHVLVYECLACHTYAVIAVQAVQGVVVNEVGGDIEDIADAVGADFALMKCDREQKSPERDN